MKTLMRGLTLAAMLLAVPATQADLVIDDFLDNDQVAGFSPINGPAVALTTEVAGTRTFNLVNGFGNISAVGGQFTLQLASIAAGTQAQLVYNFTNPIDLHSTGPGIEANPLKLDLFGTVIGTWELVASYTSTLFGTASFAAINIAAPGPIWLDGTALGNGALASSVNSITLNFRATSLGIVNGNPGALLQQSNASIAAVPEPASMALLGLTAVGGFFAHRRRKNQLAA